MTDGDLRASSNPESRHVISGRRIALWERRETVATASGFFTVAHAARAGRNRFAIRQMKRTEAYWDASFYLAGYCM